MEATTANQSGGTDRRIETGRLTKALAQEMVVDAIAPAMYDVHHDGETYAVDVEGGSCECKDHTYRGDRLVCKHVLRAAIAHAFRSESNTHLVARVLSAVREQGCIHDTAGCAGPTQLGERGIPCEECIAATPGHWTVYCRLMSRDEWLDTDETPVVMTDGGQDRDDPREFAGTGFEGENPRTLATDGGQAIAENELPEIEVISRTHTDRPLRGRCTGCGNTGPAGLKDNWIILHDRDCPRDELDVEAGR